MKEDIIKVVEIKEVSVGNNGPEEVAADKEDVTDGDVRVMLKEQRRVVLRTGVAEMQTEDTEDVISAAIV